MYIRAISTSVYKLTIKTLDNPCSTTCSAKIENDNYSFMALAHTQCYDSSSRERERERNKDETPPMYKFRLHLYNMLFDSRYRKQRCGIERKYHTDAYHIFCNFPILKFYYQHHIILWWSLRLLSTSTRRNINWRYHCELRNENKMKTEKKI